VLDNEPGDWAIIAPTYGDARDVCVEGPSGLIQALGGRRSPLIENWNRSIGELFLASGAKVYIDGADDGALRVQGKNLRGAWCDEVGLWRDWDISWNESLAFAVRLDPGRIVATGTPKTGHPLVRLLLSDTGTQVTHMRTLDNAANLQPAALAYLLEKWQGTRRGRQELEGEFLDEVLGALWAPETIEKHRVREAPPLDRVVVGVDPSGAADEDSGSNEIGIVVAGFCAHDQQWYVVGDYSLTAGPADWARATVAAYELHKADVIVAERNFGGEMVRHTIRTADANAPVKLVNSSRGKAVRAEPISLLYEQGKVHHVGVLPELEDQMCHWVPPQPGESRRDSPDRMDALVFALTELSGGGQARQVSYAQERGGEPVVRRGDLTLVGDRYVDKG
jgi:phage terminase large subunit-like protein